MRAEVRTVDGMSNTPFGFSLPGDNDPSEPSAADAGGFDLSQLGSMLSQLGSMLSQAGKQESPGPVNYQLAREMASSHLPATHPVSAVDAAAATDALSLAEVWLDGATVLPAGATSTEVWTPQQWIDKTMPTWEVLCTPIAEQVSQAWIAGLPEEARQMAGPLLSMMSHMGGMAFGSQLGQGLAQLAGEVLTSSDIGLPLGPVGVAALLPRAIAELSTGVELPEDQVRLYLAAREAAHHRLLKGAPWLRDRVTQLITAYSEAISVDFSAMEDLASTFDPADPSSIENMLSSGMFQPVTTPEQERARTKLETLLALVEGWVMTVVEQAVGDRLPQAAAIQETFRRRRATGGPAEQTFETLIGLEFRPRRMRAAATIWAQLGETRGLAGRDALWNAPDLLPDIDALDDPSSFLATDRDFAAMFSDDDAVWDVPPSSDTDGDADTPS